MKLLRLTTDNSDGIFDNEFNANITIEPFSKIALSNISLEASPSEIVIDDTNDTIEHQYIASSGPITFKIEHGTYNSSGIEILLTEIQNKANLSISDVGAQIGLEWNVRLDKFTKKVSFELKRSKFIDINDWILKDVYQQSIGDAIYKYTSSQTQTDTDDNQMYSDIPFCKGGGVFQARIDTLKFGGLESESGFYFGLTKTKPSTLGLCKIQNLEYGIRAFSVEDDYNIVLKGIEYNAANNVLCNPVSIENAIDGNVGNKNDVIQISLNLGKIQMKIHKESNNNVILYSQDYPEELYGVDLYPVIIFRGGQEDVILTKVKYTADPYFNKIQYNFPIETLIAGFNPPSQSNVSTNMFLRFGSVSVARFLGFSNQRFPQEGTVKGPEYIYESDNRFIVSDVIDSFIFQLMNINLESYDSLSKQRKNILSVIPKTESVKGQIVYEASNLIFLDINNTTTLNLRNIKGQILKFDLSSLKIAGVATATILIKSKDE